MGRQEIDVCVVGAGPAGLTAAIEAARYNLSVALVDSSIMPGGQLTKQIHRFFGPRDHRAGLRGTAIAQELYEEALDLGVRCWFDSEVYAVSRGTVVEIVRGLRKGVSPGGSVPFKDVLLARKLVLAAGASEKSVAFPGWTLPGVMGAGATQAFMNVERVLPGKRFLIVGSGNVGLIVAYQLLQAGARVSCIVEAAPNIGGYAVHAAKVRRAGVPILTGHTITRALGDRQVCGAEIARVNEKFQVIEGSQKTLDVDTVCIAAGLKPYAKLASLAGCRLTYVPSLGGWVPLHNEEMVSTVKDVYVAGDLAGVEEAGIAMEEGRVAGLSAALGLDPGAGQAITGRIQDALERLDRLRSGPFGHKKHMDKQGLIDKWYKASSR
ncbi:MAG: NAD(P)/FAD-dependent oxidoreductase [Bacillota bacterium]|jgi:thioredoxin reductase